jgi:hypothetical protein
MKNLSTLSKRVAITLVVALFAMNTFAADYQSMMKTTLAKLHQTQQADSLTNVAATFYRIGQTQPNEWLPYYYAAYSYISITFKPTEPAIVDATLDKAQQMIDLAIAIKPNESELFVLQGLLYSMRITDASRGYKYSTLSNEALAKAEVLNPNNPRIYFCKGQNVMHTPAFFGGGKDKALPLFEKSKALFASQQPTNELMPAWGLQPLDSLITACKE